MRSPTRVGITLNGSGTVCRVRVFPSRESRVVTDAEGRGDAAQLACRGGPSLLCS
jgi:hypothetical protein